MHSSLVLGLNLPRLLFGLQVEPHSPLDGVLLSANLVKLLGADTVLEGARLLLVVEVLRDGVVHPVLEIHVQLVLEGVSPVVLVSQELHRGLEVLTEEVLSDIHTLKLLHGVELLLSLLPSVIKCLVLLLDPGNLSFDLLLPISVLQLPSLVVLIFELPDLLKLVLLLDLKDSLLHGLVEQHVEDWLHFHIVIEQVVVFDLGDFVDAGLLGDVLGSWWFRLENIRLQFHFCFIWLSFALLGQEVREVNLDPCWWSRPQVIGTSSVFGFLELHELRFDHLDLLLLPHFFDALLFLLGRR